MTHGYLENTFSLLSVSPFLGGRRGRHTRDRGHVIGVVVPVVPGNLGFTSEMLPRGISLERETRLKSISLLNHRQDKWCLQEGEDFTVVVVIVDAINIGSHHTAVPPPLRLPLLESDSKSKSFKNWGDKELLLATRRAYVGLVSYNIQKYTRTKPPPLEAVAAKLIAWARN